MRKFETTLSPELLKAALGLTPQQFNGLGEAAMIDARDRAWQWERDNWLPRTAPAIQNAHTGIYPGHTARYPKLLEREQ